MRLSEFFRNTTKPMNEASGYAKFSDEQLQKRLVELETAYSLTKAKTKELLDSIDDVASDAYGLIEITKVAGISEYEIQIITEKLNEANQAIYSVEQEVADAIRHIEYEIEERNYNEESFGEATKSSNLPATTPRNFVAKNAKTAGAGQHKDPRRAEQQVRGQKHKKPVGVE